MSTHVLRSAEDIPKLGQRLALRTKFPLTVTVTQGATQGKKQNRLAQRWYTDIARQLGDQTHEEVRAECKLDHGVPIMRAENEAFRQSWDAAMGHLTREQKLLAIEKLDIPVTRLMLAKQMTAYMNEMTRFWSRQHIHLTDPEALKYEEEFA